MSGSGSGSGEADQAVQWWVDGSWQDAPPGLVTPGKSPYSLAIDANEFPDLVEAIRYANDVDGYLRAIGVSEQTVSADDDGDAGVGGPELAGT